MSDISKRYKSKRVTYFITGFTSLFLFLAPDILSQFLGPMRENQNNIYTFIYRILVWIPAIYGVLQYNCPICRKNLAYRSGLIPPLKCPAGGVDYSRF